MPVLEGSELPLDWSSAAILGIGVSDRETLEGLTRPRSRRDDLRHRVVQGFDSVNQAAAQQNSNFGLLVSPQNATHREPSKFLGPFPVERRLMVVVEPTGKHFEVWHVHWFKLRDGRLVGEY
jgi:hypothetical protein